MLETFKQLKQNDKIRVSMTDALIGKRLKTLSVGRRTHSKKYNVEKLTLFQVNKDGLPDKYSCKYYFYYRPDSNLLTLAMADMGCSFTDIEILN
tara:strand:- start:571 stop:852 length:282 start_codon:yes stop_codon:yes gene_type:complete